MDRLAGLSAFVHTADLGSFVAAGRVLGLSPSAVGKAVTRLENQLGIRLLQRSTRSLRLTDEGRAFHERCRRILDDLDDAHASVLRARETPRGRVRLSCPIVAYHLLLPVLPAFMARYPEVTFDLDFTDRIVDLIEEGVDVAIRSGQLPDSRIMVRTLRPFRLLICASPSYLASFGLPRVPRDLAGHRSIGFRFPNSGKIQAWPLRGPGGDAEPHSGHVIVCNNMEALYGAVRSGLGIGCMPDFLVASALQSGTLVALLSDHLDAPGQFNVIWPSSRHMSPKVRAVVDFLAERLFSSECHIPCSTPAQDAAAPDGKDPTRR